ncbi:MAG TPA: pyruvate ferredoxin oxidoreductase, partial [Anaerolineae bacterium]|nr:pyruvate ferredoxin oxidoreductase [Anaerolineae bacterium]
SGWIVLFSESAQEAYHNLIQAVPIAEHPDVLLPVVVCQDGFITSHGVERVEVFDDSQVQAFVGEYQPAWPLLDLDNPKTSGPVAFYDYYYEHKRHQIEAMNNANRVILEVAGKFKEQFGPEYGLFETYRLEDAEVAVVVLNSTAGTAKVAVDRLRDEGQPVGLLKPRVFRPFPGEELAGSLSHLKALAVMDRSVSFGATGNAGPLFLELVATLALHGVHLPVIDFVYGIGGRDILAHDIEEIYHELLRVAKTGQVDQPVKFIGVRE